MEEFVYDGKNILVSSISEPLHAKIKYDAHLWIEDGVVFKNHTGWDEEKLRDFVDTINSDEFYFVFYECNIVTKGLQTNGYTQKCQAITNKHPLRWQMEVNKKYANFHNDGRGGQRKEEYFVINWKEITLKEYLEFKGHIG